MLKYVLQIIEFPMPRKVSCINNKTMHISVFYYYYAPAFAEESTMGRKNHMFDSLTFALNAFNPFFWQKNIHFDIQIKEGMFHCSFIIFIVMDISYFCVTFLNNKNHNSSCEDEGEKNFFLDFLVKSENFLL